MDWFTPEIVWFLIGLALIIMEFAAPGVLTVFFGIGAWLVVFVLMIVDISLNMQIAIFIVGSVTRMRVRKGIEEFIRAMAHVHDRIPAAHFVIAGEVEFEGPLASLVRDLNLKEHITLLGRRRDVPEVLSAFDLFVLSSVREGLPVTLLEAMAAGTPVASTDVGGIPEAVKDGDSALLVSPGDPEALAEAAWRVLSDRALGMSLAKNASTIVEERFSMAAVSRKICEIYSKKLSEKRAG